MYTRIHASTVARSVVRPAARGLAATAIATMLSVGALAVPAGAAEDACGTPAQPAVYENVTVPAVTEQRLVSEEVPEITEQVLVSEEVPEITEEVLVTPEQEYVPAVTEQRLVSPAVAPVYQYTFRHRNYPQIEDRVVTEEGWNGPNAPSNGWALLSSELITPGQEAVYETVVITPEVPYAPAVYETVVVQAYQPAVYETVTVSEERVERRLVKEAVPAGPPCVDDDPDTDKPREDKPDGDDKPRGDRPDRDDVAGDGKDRAEEPESPAAGGKLPVAAVLDAPAVKPDKKAPKKAVKADTTEALPQTGAAGGLGAQALAGIGLLLAGLAALRRRPGAYA